MEYELAEARKRLDRQEQAVLDELLPQAFAAVREAARRTIGLRHYDVQLLGGIAMHKGMALEMRTGEGKTMVAPLALYLQGLLGHGAHLVTVNDYLAKRDVQWMGPVYQTLGMNVGVIQSAGSDHPDKASYRFDSSYKAADDRYQHLRPVTRKETYDCDITYGTNNEFGFDYLRNQMVFSNKELTQRPDLAFAVVDELDNILVDEARTPLIISDVGGEPSPYLPLFADLARKLRPGGDINIDPKMRIVTLTPRGLEKFEAWIRERPEFKSLVKEQVGGSLEVDWENPEVIHLLAYLDRALHAEHIFKLEGDYIIRNGELIIVDEFTARLLQGRRFSEGLHEALEAKEGLKINRSSVSLATISFQCFFRHYRRLAGMTGTAKEAEEELHKVYHLPVLVLPTNVEFRTMQGQLKRTSHTEERSGEQVKVVEYFDPITGRTYFRRIDFPDRFYGDARIKLKHVLAEIKTYFRQRRPILVGTEDIELSEFLARRLRAEGISHEVLNAKEHEKEAEIIAQAGCLGAVTIATGMAGRGVDILLGGNPEGLARKALRKAQKDLTNLEPGEWEAALAEAQEQCAADREKVIALGGLHLIGTCRQESRRMDNQLRGRAGRQGDPGSTRFYLSLEDSLVRRFVPERKILELQEAMGEKNAATGKMGEFLFWTIGQAQKRAEGYNFDIRKMLLDFDEVLEAQRKAYYASRQQVVSMETQPLVTNMIREEIAELCQEHLSNGRVDKKGRVTKKGTLALYQALRDEPTLPIPESGQFDINIRHHILPVPADALTRWAGLTVEEVAREATAYRLRAYAERTKDFERIGVKMEDFERIVILRIADGQWVKQMEEMDELREGISLRAYGQVDPLVAFKREGTLMFQKRMREIRKDIIRGIFRSTVILPGVSALSHLVAPPSPPDTLSWEELESLRSGEGLNLDRQG
ncbi:hypothetical protein A2160_00995 [Candidatus Beckwithbacteria bacterium RBG_13_42_9]|uniref:Protein translocase subunit SecA n=1 Tax=Candidatus Beckwithbacteria bacterium RBG_13_42_9 TaxID=1797457 RepID=A0A1F5E3H4_9BACT|nr:MAG: hypothetical protein A2160_00995 [Candidatus Beckwithbacteria bacterium RBG_13_42_9]